MSGTDGIKITRHKPVVTKSDLTHAVRKVKFRFPLKDSEKAVKGNGD